MKKHRPESPQKPAKAVERRPPDPAEVCPVCGARGEPLSCKIICPRCRIVLVNCSGS